LPILADVDILRDSDADAALFHKAKELWLTHIKAQRHNLSILGNAAEFFADDEPALSKELLLRAGALDPRNPEWVRRLGKLELDDLEDCSVDRVKAQTQQGFFLMESALQLTADEESRFDMLSEVANAALAAGQIERARSYAVELLQTGGQPNFVSLNGDAHHQANVLLGRLSLRDGDIEKAKIHLREAGKTTGSPVLKSFGPNMSLAKELLESGERDVVIEFLNLCTKFWYTPDHEPQKWIHAIEQGEIPDFGANLSYV